MRKYFLTTAVALLVTTNANALSGESVPTALVGNMQVGAQILMGQSMTCDYGITFSPVVMDASIEHTVTVNTDGSVTTSGEGVIAGGVVPGVCTLSNGTFTDGGDIVPMVGGDMVTLKPVIDADSGYEVYMSNFTYKISDDQKNLYVGATLTIPANIASDVYMATIPVMYMYE